MNIDPKFDFLVPDAYIAARNRKLFGYQNQDSALDPWFYLDAENVFDAHKKWPGGSNINAVELIVFARRFDNDDMACFAVSDNKAEQIVVIHGWTSSGYDIVNKYPSFWHWIKSVIDDVALVSSFSESDQHKSTS